MPATLAEAMVHERVGFDDLHRRYSPVLNMVDVLIGVVPNCDRYLEIWQPGFRTYNLMVPNFLNLPLMLLGVSAPKELVGLGMYASSRAASCAYCSAHCCSFALRRGASPGAVTGAQRSERETATVALAESLSTIPHHYGVNHGEALCRHVSSNNAEWIVMGVAMMGFLNKFMDALGVELEPEAVGDVASLIESTGWSVGQHGWSDDHQPVREHSDTQTKISTGPKKDSLTTLLHVARNAPGAIRLDRQWHAGIPKQPAMMRQHLIDKHGFDEPLLTAMQHQRPRRALTAMLDVNLDVQQSKLGIAIKSVVGIVFAEYANNTRLLEQMRSLAIRHEVDPAIIDAVARGDRIEDSGHMMDTATHAALTLARAIAPSPSAVDSSTLSLATESLSAEQIVEITVWVSLCQLLHRLCIYFFASEA